MASEYPVEMTARPTPLETYVDNSRVGIVDAVGQTFSLDWRSASVKLRNHRLASHELVLKLVQFGHLGATSIEITTDLGFRVVYDGVKSDVTLEAIVKEMNSAVPSKHEALAHLGIGLSGLLSLGGELVLRLREPERSRCVRICQGESWFDEEPTEQCEQRRLTLEIARTPALSPQRLRALLQKRCAYLRPALRYNGAPLQYRLPDVDDGVGSQEFSLRPRALGRTSVEGKMVDCWRLVKDADSVVWLCKAGVLVERKAISVSPPVIAIVEADGLRTDLSGLRVVEDESWTRLSEGLRTEIRARDAQLPQSPVLTDPHFLYRSSRASDRRLSACVLAFFGSFFLAFLWVMWVVGPTWSVDFGCLFVCWLMKGMIGSFFEQCPGRLTPFYDRPLKDAETCGHGRAILSNFWALEDLAVRLAVPSFSSFGFPDALHGEVTAWHSARSTLRTVEALKASIADDPRGFFQVEELLDDLERMEEAFAAAQRQGIKVAFVWDFASGTNSLVWEHRGGYPTGWAYMSLRTPPQERGSDSRTPADASPTH